MNDIINPLDVKEEDDYSWLELPNIPKVVINPFDYSLTDQPVDPVDDIMQMFMNKDYLHFAVKTLLNVDLLPYQLVILDVLWNKRLPMLIASRGGSKSFMLSVYALLRMIFHPRCKIVIVGAAFRQSRQLHEYMTTIWENAPILRDIAEKGGGPKREVDRCEFWIGDSVTYAIPLGTGEKIRGLRANYILVDEFASVPESIFNLVVQGFAVVSASPVEKVKQAAVVRKLKEMGEWSDELETLRKNGASGNQIVYSGTAFYSFNHFYKYFKKWHAIISTKGDPEKIKDFMGENDASMEGFNWKDYAILRIPYTCLPEDYLDPGIVSQAKATLNKGQFLMEYGACLHPNQEIITDRGLKKIKNIEVGDNVLTHMGRFRQVTKKTYRKSESLIKLKNFGSNISILATKDHPFLQNNQQWSMLSNVENTFLAKLKELNGKNLIDLKNYTKDTLDTIINNVEYIYPKPSQSRNHQDKHILYKSCVHRYIKLDYYFGLILGYYAAEGSTGANGKQIEFSLDGHRDIKLKQFIIELKNAIKIVFNKESNVFYKENENVANVCLNSRIIVDLFKNICPGVSHTKKIDPEILYSNEELLKGFLTGYWHGDGCMHYRNGNKNSAMAVAKCVNKSLLSQIRLCLSYFDIGSSLNFVYGKKTSIFRGEEYDGKQAYVLSVHGGKANYFDHMINGTVKNPKKLGLDSTKIKSNDQYIEFQHIKKELVDYNDIVYNIEVEEDNSYSLINATVHNCFQADSDGFFRRSVIENATTNTPILVPSGRSVQFSALRYGDKDKVYTMAIDPAADQDNAAIIVLELYQDHRRVVNCWTTNRKKFNSYKKNLPKGSPLLDDDYYRYIAKKIKHLMSVFNIERILMDKNGGGIAIEELLGSKHICAEGELPILPLIDPEDPKPTDMKEGIHILELIKPTLDLNAEANHGMLKDLQEKVLLFPMFDTIEMEKCLQLDIINNIKYDTYEDLVQEIEELKNEMTTIIVTPSSILGKETFDTPQIKIEGSRKGHLRKDRYSALLYGNYYARTKDKNTMPKLEYRAVGGNKDMTRRTIAKSSTMYSGPGTIKFGASKWMNGQLQGYYKNRERNE